jgi:hypothetical protein
MPAVMVVLVHDCGWGGVVRCGKLYEAGHMMAQLCDKVRWFHWVRCRGQ